LLSARALPSIALAAGALELPGVIDTWTKVDWVRGHFRETLRADFGAEGYRLLSWHDEGCQRIMSRGHTVRRVADLAHRRLAAIETDPLSQAVYSFVPGAVPISLAEPDVSASLRDASRLGVSVVIGTSGEAERFGWTRSLEHVTMMPVACTSGAFLLRGSAYDRMPEEIRNLVDDVSARAEEAAAPRAREDDTGSSLRLARSLSPVEPTDAERREWQKFFLKSAPLYAQRGVPQTLVDRAIALGREIDALE
jgi:TRAP-type C4-dicarboxylate transport system substrate-binding protein